MLQYLVSITLILLLKETFGTFGVDLSTACDQFTCLHNDYSCEFIVTRAWKSYGAFDSSAPTNLQNAQNSGIKYTDVYMFPCRSQSAQTQMDDLINDLANSVYINNNYYNLTDLNSEKFSSYGLQAGKRDLIKRRSFNSSYYSQEKIEERLNNNLLNDTNRIPFWHLNKKNNNNNEASYGMIWLDIEDNPSSGCSWTSYSSSSNCDYIQQLASAGVAKGKSIGIYSSEYEWENVIGSRYGCTEVSTYPIWYAHYDGVASFSDWSSVAFGGWKTPAAKQYAGDVTLCSTNIDKNYY